MYKISKLLIGIFIFTQFISCTNKQSDRCLSGNEENIYQTPPISLQIDPNGILISLGDIPDDITSINIDIYNWGDRVYTYQNDDYPIRRDMISSSMANIEGESLDYIKQTKSIIFPFVKQGEKYNIFVTYLKPGFDCASTVSNQIIAENGIYLENDIELILNADNTSVHLSEEPKFTSDIEYSDNAHSFSFYVFNDKHTSVYGGISTKNKTREISWDFEPSITEQIKRSREIAEIREPERESYISGVNTAFIQLSINIIFDKIEWYNYFIQSSRFTYTIL